MLAEVDDTRPLRRDAAANRAGILSAATELIARDPHASLDTIARHAGLSRRALYGHFLDRESLIGEVIQTGAQRFNAIARDVDDPDARIALAQLTSRLWAEAAIVQLSAALAVDDVHVGRTAAALAPLRDKVLAIVTRGQKDRVLRTDVSPPTLARLIEETARGVITRMDAGSPAARSLAVRAVLSISGLSWQEAVALLADHPELVKEN